MNDPKEFKSSAYSCYRCGENKFTFNHLTNERMDVICTSCKMTISDIEKDKPFGNPLKDVIICDPDGVVSKGSDVCKIIITKIGDSEKITNVLKLHCNTVDTSFVLPYVCDGDFDPFKTQVILKELKNIGCEAIRFNATVPFRAQEAEEKRKLRDIKMSVNSARNAEEVEKIRVKEEIEKARREKQEVIKKAEAEIVKIKRKFGKKLKEVQAELAARKQVNEIGDSSRFEELL